MTHFEPLAQMEALQDAIQRLKDMRAANVSVVAIWRMFDHAIDQLDSNLSQIMHAEY